MRIGVVFPHHAIGSDPVVIRDWAQAAEDLGFDRVIIYEHLLLPAASAHPTRVFPYTNTTALHEPLVLCGFLAAATRRIGLQTGVIVAPLHETIILAKQAAEVDVLSGGRLRLGVGVGWMEFEFEALGRSFRTRGARLDEQMALMRALWTSDSVTFHGREHHIEGAGLNPLPVQQPIPMWVGGGVRASVRRAARLGDGWIVPGIYLGQLPDADARQALDWLRAEEASAGRPAGSLGVQGVMSIGRGAEAEWAARADAWQQFGATDLPVVTGVSQHSSDAALDTVAAQLKALPRIKEALGHVTDVTGWVPTTERILGEGS